MTDHKTALREMFSSIEGHGDVDAAIDTYLAEDFIEHEEVPGMGQTRETPRQLFTMLQGALTGFRIDVQDMLEDGDKVVARISFVGTQTGEFMGVPPTGRPVHFDAIDILRFRGDQCIEHWGVMDMAGAMAQMGVQMRLAA